MPVYIYTCCECGENTELSRSMDERHDEVMCACGEAMGRNIGEEQSPRKQVKQYYAESNACGVQPEDVAERHAWDKRHGVTADGWTRDGNPVFHTMNKHRQYAAQHGLHHKND